MEKLMERSPYAAIVLSIMVSSIAAALAQQSVENLLKMVAAARDNVQRAQFEVAVIEEALASAEGRANGATEAKNGSAPSSSQLSPSEKRELVFLVLQELGPDPVPPRAITEVIGDDSINVYNALGQLKKAGRVRHFPLEGLYGLPGASIPTEQSSANGQAPAGQGAGTQLRQPSFQVGP